MKTSLITAAVALAALLIAAALTSCAGLTLSASAPWGDVTSDGTTTTFAPRPIVIPVK